MKGIKFPLLVTWYSNAIHFFIKNFFDAFVDKMHGIRIRPGILFQKLNFDMKLIPINRKHKTSE